MIWLNESTPCRGHIYTDLSSWFTSRVPKSLIFLLMSSHFGTIPCFLVKSSSFIQFLSLVRSPMFAASMRFFAWFDLISGWFRSLEKQKKKIHDFFRWNHHVSTWNHIFFRWNHPFLPVKKTAASWVDPPSRLSVGLPAGISAPKPQRSETRRHPAAPA